MRAETAADPVSIACTSALGGSVGEMALWPAAVSSAFDATPGSGITAGVALGTGAGVVSWAAPGATRTTHASRTAARRPAARTRVGAADVTASTP